MTTSNYFQKTIKEFLDNKAKEDELFAKVYAKKEKNIEECCNYIAAQVKNSGLNGMADIEVFGLAIHYWDEDNLNVPKQSYRVVVNKEVQLTEEEKAQAKENAIKEYKQKLIDEMNRKNKKVVTKQDDNSIQPSLF